MVAAAGRKVVRSRKRVADVGVQVAGSLLDGAEVANMASDVRWREAVNPDVGASETALTVFGGQADETVARVDGKTSQVLSPEREDAILAALSSEDVRRIYLNNQMEGQRSYQQTMDLFDQGVSVIDSPEDIFLKKAAHKFRFSAQLKLLQSKLYNAMIFAARPNLLAQEVFIVSVDYLGWIVNYNSKDTLYLKESLKEMQRVLVEVPEGDKWLSIQLINEVLIEGDSLYYKIPPFFRKLYSLPDRYYYMSMLANAQINSKYTMALYELLKEYEWRGQTGHIPLNEFRARMGVQDDEYPEFKRFSSRVIAPAIKELAEIGEIVAEVVYGREKRFITSVNFLISSGPKRLNHDGRYLEPERFKELREEFGLNPAQITELTKSFNVERLELISDVLLYRYVIQQPKRGVKNAFALFKSALKDAEDKYILTTAEKTELAMYRARRKEKEEAAEAQRRAADAERRAIEVANDRRMKLDEFWVQLSGEAQENLWEEFLQAPESKAFRTKRGWRGCAPDVTLPLVRSGFMEFLGRLGHI